MNVDLVVVYRAKASKDEVKSTSEEYSRLVQTLKNGGLTATGKKGEKLGQVLVFVHCSDERLSELAHTDASRTYIHGLNSSRRSQSDPIALSPADRNRLIYLYVCSSSDDGGLGITPGAREWSRVESVMSLHDQQWNNKWIKKWSTSLDVSGSLEQLRAQFGESLAMYFAFLSFYMRSLVPPAALGVLAFFFLGAFSPIYSVGLLLWSLVFVEWWSIKERKLAVRWGVRGASNVELLRAEYNSEGDLWWKREMKVLASVPVVLIFGALLIALMTAIFVFEAFVTQLYNGPGHQHVGLAPTVAFVILVPRLLNLYHTRAVQLTEWENHPRQSSYDRSLTLKTFALAAVVAYGGLALSAFVYVPFGSQIMRAVQSYLTVGPSEADSTGKVSALFKTDASGFEGAALIQSMKGDRLRNQVFAFTVTNQVINFVQEVVVPWVMEGVENVRSKGKLGGKKKRVEWEDEAAVKSMSKEDRELLEAARTEASLPDYSLFGDYNEMIMQFGYVVVWSTCWPLAPAMALINNWIELRSDAFKIAKLGRRPLPSRTDSIGAWANALSFLTWLGALINAALIYLFNPSTGTFASAHAHANTTFTDTFLHPNATAEMHAAYPSAGSEPQIPHSPEKFLNALHGRGSSIMLSAVVIALLASHGYIVLRAAVRHVLERALWKGSEEEKMVEARDLEVREAQMRAVAENGEKNGNVNGAGIEGVSSNLVASEGFWVDEGAEEISNSVKME